MTYKELQAALKGYKLQGLTEIKLTASKEVLQAEFDKIVKELEGFTTEELNIVENIKTNSESNQETSFELATNTYIEIIEKTLLAEFNCNYKIKKSEITKNKHKIVKKFLRTIAKKTGINELNFCHVLQENVENYFYDLALTGYEYHRLDSFLEIFAKYLSEIETTEETEETTPVLEIVEETDPSLDIAIQYFVDAVNHVFKRFGSDNFITSGYLTHYLVNDISIGYFIKFLNLNTGFEFTEFMEYLEYHLEDKYEYFIQYSFLNYRKYPVKMILQDFAEVINIHQLVA
jgi:hypothetical protein